MSEHWCRECPDYSEEHDDRGYVQSYEAEQDESSGADRRGGNDSRQLGGEGIICEFGCGIHGGDRELCDGRCEV